MRMLNSNMAGSPSSSTIGHESDSGLLVERNPIGKGPGIDVLVDPFGTAEKRLGVLVVDRMTVITRNAWAVEGTTRQPPPQPGLPDPMSDFIKLGEWGPGFNAQNKMLDDFSEEYNLQDQDWRKTRPWYKPGD